MFELMLAETFVNAAILCLLLFLIAKHEADFSFSKVAMVVAGIQLGGFLAQVFLFDMIGWFTLAVSFVLAFVMVEAFCWLNISKTILVVVLFCIFQTGTKIGFNAIAAYFSPEIAQQQDAELGEVVKMLNAQVEGGEAPAPPQVPTLKQKGSPLPDWKTARENLKLGGAMLNDKGGYVAIVNGEIVEVGDIVKEELGRVVFRWKVSAISKHDIDFERMDAQPK